MGGIFGGSKSKSWNKAYDTINPWAQALMGNAGTGAGYMSSLLGGDATGFNAFKDAVGYDWALKQGTGDIVAQRAALGGLDSGASLKSLAEYQTGLNNQYLDQYMTGSNNLANIGVNAANILTSAGQMSKSKSTGGLASLIGAASSAVAKGASGGF